MLCGGRLADCADSDLIMRVHLLTIPNAPSTRASYLDGFAQMGIRFATVLKRLGAEVFLYGSAENEAPCDRHYCCISHADQTRLIGDVPYQCVSFDPATELFQKFNTAAAHQIAKIKAPHDIIATISGSASLPVFQQHPELMDLEYSIGYRGVCASYRVYQSQIWRHCAAGFTGVDLGRPFDAVIPTFFDAQDFPFVAQPDPYVVFCGRVNEVKGIHIACEAAKRAGVPLKVIGVGDRNLVTYGDYLGAMPDTERNEILGHATAVIMPTLYLEPFGNVSAEAQLCGTPVIGPDFGAFVETIEPGVSGFQCASLGEYIQALQMAGSLDRINIHARAQRLYSMSTAIVAYRRYFARLESLRGDGWNSTEPTLPVPESVLSFA